MVVSTLGIGELVLFLNTFQAVAIMILLVVVTVLVLNSRLAQLEDEVFMLNVKLRMLEERLKNVKKEC